MYSLLCIEIFFKFARVYNFCVNKTIVILCAFLLLFIAYGNGRATGDITYDSDDEMPSYEFLELTNDSSQHGFLNANNSTITSSSSAKIGNLSNANINAPHCSGGSGGGGVNNNSGHRHAVGIKTSDLDDDEEFVENSDID